MKLAKVSYAGKHSSAVIDGRQAKIIGPWIAGDPYALPFDYASYSLEQLQTRVNASTETLQLADVALLIPVGPLSKIICLGHNYKTHADETQHQNAENPGLFTKVPDALVGHGSPLIKPTVSECFDYEGEIVVVIGKPGRHISKEKAMEHVFGYSIMMDGSVRDYQKHSVTAGKNFLSSGALGPWIVTSNEISDPSSLTMETRLSGQTVQSTSADLMIYDIPTAIEFISRWTPLQAGVVIATGTPGGVGSKRTPPLWMKKGDRIEVEVSSIGVLSNPIEDEA